MSTTINTGWLKDNNGDKFAPKTLTSQVQTSDGILLENKIETDILYVKDEMQAYIDTVASGKASSSHSHDDIYYTESEIDTKLSNKSDKTHDHDTVYDAKGSASDALTEAKEYTNTKTLNLASNSTVDTKISTHNTSTSAHNDIRDLINGLSTRLNTLADSDDTTLDQMSEIVEYIKANKTLIDSVTTSKVNVSDIVNNLTTNTNNKPLSAAQGVAIKALIDALSDTVDTKVDKVSGKGLSTNDYTTTEKNKLAGIASNAEVNQNAFSNVKIGDTTISADAKTDTLTFAAGSNITLTPDATNDKITIAAKDTVYTHPTTSGNKHIPSGGKSGQVLKWSADGVAAWGDDKDTTYSGAGTSLGLVKTGGDVTITDGVITVNDDSHAHVIGNVDGLQSALDGKAASSHTHTIGNISNLQATLDGKAPSSHTHKVANISDLTATATELNYMDGVTSNVQAQIDAMKGSILDTMEEINANTQDNQLAGALAVKELKNSIYDSERIVFTPSDTGWWRVAKMSNANANYARGTNCSGCEIDIRRNYNTLDNECHRVSLVFNYYNAEFVNETSKCNSKIINHIRLTHDTTNNDTYIEIWYDQKLANDITITLSQHINVVGQKWTPITPVAASDSTEGVDVLALHSFSDNCEFATDLDLDKIKNQLGEIKFKYISMPYEADGASFELCIKNNWSSLDVGFYVLKVNVGSEAIAFVQKTNELYGTVIYFNYGGALRVFIIANGVWYSENEIITETILKQKLINYLPLNGGIMNENANIKMTGYTGGMAAVGYEFYNNGTAFVTKGGIGALFNSGVLHHVYMSANGSYETNKGLAIYENAITWKDSKVLTSADFVVTGSANEATLTINLD